MGAHTAWMLEPYQDGGLGMPAMPVAEIVNVIRQAEQHGWAVSIHAIGDRANRELLDIFETMSDLTSRAGMPHRIEHVQLLHPVDIPRLARLGLTASVQPVHLLDDMVLVDKIWGERGQYAYAFRSLLQAGTVLAFGSDCPVADPNPWLGIHAAVNRRKPSGQPEGGWYPEQCLTVAEAVWGYTLANATAIGQHERLGSLVPGKLADLIVLDRDIFNIDPLALAETQVLMTIFDGEIVYEADSR
jgi:predicted amidohydrolase YtcJ